MYKGKQKLQVKVVTPRGTKVDERADMVILRCTTGDMGILPGHQPFSMLLDYGVLRMVQQDRERILAVYGGIAQVKGDQITILTDGADWPEEIDPVRAEADRSAAERRLAESGDRVAAQQDRALLDRARLQLSVRADQGKSKG
ncbi:MAG: ATP synthase F1 subunit epsilon [Clostridiales bacterium]|nr:ATP synthase F1 subunit epsilon [Clostridiales bacterium]